MFSKLNRLVLATALCVGGLSAGSLDANAASPGYNNHNNAMGLQQGNMRGPMSWQMHRDGNRCLTRSANCQHFHNGYYYQNSWWALPLVLGGVAIAANNGGGSHVEWCSAHYRSYTPETDTWFGNDGQRHRCVSAY